MAEIILSVCAQQISSFNANRLCSDQRLWGLCTRYLWQAVNHFKPTKFRQTRHAKQIHWSHERHCYIIIRYSTHYFRLSDGDMAMTATVQYTLTSLNFPNGNFKKQWSDIGIFICYQNIVAKNKLNLHIYGIHLLSPYKTVVSHLKFLSCYFFSSIETFSMTFFSFGISFIPLCKSSFLFFFHCFLFLNFIS